VASVLTDLDSEAIEELQKNLKVSYPIIFFSRDAKYGSPMTRPKLSPDVPCTDSSGFPEVENEAYYYLEMRDSIKCSQATNNMQLNYTMHALDGARSVNEYMLQSEN